MILHAMPAAETLRAGDSVFTFTDCGDAFRWHHGSTMINAFSGNPLNGAPGGLWLRLYDKEGLSFYPLIGRHSGAAFTAHPDRLLYQGLVRGISYEIVLRLSEDGCMWFYDIRLSGSNVRADLIYAQDLGLANTDSNELYAAQYADHSIFDWKYGKVICTRQNLDFGAGHPVVTIGSIGLSATGYLTDGMQFFGLSHKRTGIPEALTREFPNVNRQFELSMPTLCTEKFTLSGERRTAFFGMIAPDHEDAVRGFDCGARVLSAYERLLTEDVTPLSSAPGISPVKAAPGPAFGAPYCSPEFTDEELISMYPDARFTETLDLTDAADPDHTIASFFTSDGAHVVTGAKECLTERPHGHILLGAFDPEALPIHTPACSCFMNGGFCGQLVVGNSSMNCFLSVQRGLLDIGKYSGIRIYVRHRGRFRVLALPALFEMQPGCCTWKYRLDDDVLTIRAFMVFGKPEFVLSLDSALKRGYDFRITNDLTLDPDEHSQDLRFTRRASLVTLTPTEGAFVSGYYPDFSLNIRIPKDCTVSDDAFLYRDGCTRNECLLTFGLQKTDHFEFTYSVRETEDVALPASKHNAKKEAALFSAHYRKLLRGFQLQLPGHDSSAFAQTMSKAEVLLPWYLHDALVHFASPHGLEQSGGAAWGTRDVCQGPVELFMTLGLFELVRKILIKTFSMQLRSTGEWPQWFMFDRYPWLQEDCHGDIVFWPLKALSEYIDAAGDLSILDELIPYSDDECRPDGPAVPLLSHVRTAVDKIRSRFIPGTCLISYAGGDWDDTLQPANEALKTRLVSVWTQALAGETLKKLSCIPALREEVLALSEAITLSLNRDCIPDGTVAGFLYVNEDGTVSPMLHPADTMTGIRARLLPQTRSIISGAVTPAQASRNIEFIEDRLHCPDGVRLMDRPARYDGGTCTVFVRAEQAANVGREISLQYVHAHIRHIQAMTEACRGDLALRGLREILPVGLREEVPNAGYRQSNVYFSSSDGAFNDRYQYEQEFDRLRAGDITVNAGWRLYSSGPGILIARILRDILGVRINGDHVEFSPMLPADAGELRFQMELFGRLRTIVIAPSGKRASDTAESPALLYAVIGKKEYPAVPINRYGRKGVTIPADALSDMIRLVPE